MERVKRKNINSEWKFSWRGSVPFFLVKPLFVNPVEKFLKKTSHLQEYLIITKDYGKNVEAHIKTKDTTDRNFLNEVLSKYPLLIKESKDLIKRYEYLMFGKADVKPGDFLKIIAHLEKNMQYYLALQPEYTDHLGIELLSKIKEANIDTALFDEIIIPEKTILDDVHAAKIRLKNLPSNHKKIRSFYWEYRSFYVDDLDSIDFSLKKVVSDIDSTPELIKKSFERITLPKNISQIAIKIKRLSALRLEAKNCWVNLALLSIIMFNKLFSSSMKNHTIEEILSSGKKHTHRTHSYIIKRDKTTVSHNAYVFPDSKKAYVKGQTAYPGIIEGTAVVVQITETIADKLDFFKRLPNPILIAEQTVPVYLPLIRLSKGIITSEGGILSHAAIVAREFKIPALIGTGNATKLFKTGDKILLDTKKNIAYKKLT
jgi:phosphoenolpyruvate synthase/pyruvate phosphate dikinase